MLIFEFPRVLYLTMNMLNLSLVQIVDIMAQLQNEYSVKQLANVLRDNHLGYVQERRPVRQVPFEQAGSCCSQAKKQIEDE